MAHFISTPPLNVFARRSIILGIAIPANDQALKPSPRFGVLRANVVFFYGEASRSPKLFFKTRIMTRKVVIDEIPPTTQRLG
jgi:hypothetical protein